MGAPGECGEAFSLPRVERSLVCFLKSASGTILNSRFHTLLPFSARPIDSATRAPLHGWWCNWQPLTLYSAWPVQLYRAAVPPLIPSGYEHGLTVNCWAILHLAEQNWCQTLLSLIFFHQLTSPCFRFFICKELDKFRGLLRELLRERLPAASPWARTHAMPAPWKSPLSQGKLRKRKNPLFAPKPGSTPSELCNVCVLGFPLCKMSLIRLPQGFLWGHNIRVFRTHDTVLNPSFFLLLPSLTAEVTG